MEDEVVCLASLTQELAIEANPTQEPKVEANSTQELTVEIIEVQNVITWTPQVFPIANMLMLQGKQDGQNH